MGNMRREVTRDARREPDDDGEPITERLSDDELMVLRTLVMPVPPRCPPPLRPSETPSAPREERPRASDPRCTAPTLRSLRVAG